MAVDVLPARGAFRQLAREYGVVPVYLPLALDQETPVGVFRKLVGAGPGYLLESLAGGEDAGRYSFVGAGPRRVLVVRDGRQDAFSALRDFVAPLRAPAPPPGVTRFAGGAVGYLAYDAVRSLERLPGPARDDLGLPAAVFLDCGLIAAIDHLAQRLTLVVPARTAGADPDAVYEQALRTLAAAVAALDRPTAPGLRLPAPGAAASAPHRATVPRAQFLVAVRRARAYIEAGDAFQVVLSQRFDAELPSGAEPLDLYRALRVVSPSPYMFFLRPDPDFCLAGASPELLVRVAGRQVLTRPLAGTRPRGLTPEEDARLEAELRADAKEQAEHTMLVDLGRNDVGRVSRYGSVRVERFQAVERHSHVMHLVSDVVGELRDGLDAVDALAACFPAGTLTGAPKVRAMEIIDELEPCARGPYGGAVAALGFDGALEACITIRAFVVRGRRLSLQCGAGVVADSDPEREYEETLAKGRAGLTALGLVRAAAAGGLPVADEEVGARAGAGDR